MDGYKRHIVGDKDVNVIPAVEVTAANVSEGTANDGLVDDLAAQDVTVADIAGLAIRRVHHSSDLVRERPESKIAVCKA